MLRRCLVGAVGLAVVASGALLYMVATQSDGLLNSAQALASAENLAYYNLLKERFKVQILVAKPAAPDVSSITQ